MTLFSHRFLSIVLFIILLSLIAASARAETWSAVTPFTVGGVTNTSPYLTVAGTGAVGIGTDSPVSLLQVGSGESRPVSIKRTARRLQVPHGSLTSPVTVAGPTVKISRVENMDPALCGGNHFDTTCNAALLVQSYGNETTGMQVSGIDVEAYSVSTKNIDSFAIRARGITAENAIGVGAGAYLLGMRTTPTAYALGSEISVWNHTSTDCTYVPNYISKCIALWLSSRGLNGSDNAAAIQVGDFNGSQFHVGMGFTSNSVIDTTLYDNSNSLTSLRIDGTHTHALVSTLAAGSVGIGTLSPQTRLHVTSGENATTTVTIGELNVTSSKSCVNMNRTNGLPLSYYFNDAGVMVVETNYCR